VVPPLLAPQAQVHTEGGDGQQTAFTFTVRRFGDLSEAADGTWSLGAPSAGASASGADFAATSGAFSFAAGAATARITVAVIGDSVTEQTEGFEVLVAMPGIAAVIGRGVIINDDLAIPGAAGAEADPYGDASASPAGPTRVDVICDYDPYGWGGL
ncbi:MAG TPA: hypothetical protein VEA79_15495, partial [Phenylobacterium sp.]|nr:hypothetical protein [Phenylobacterium sp.]